MMLLGVEGVGNSYYIFRSHTNTSLDLKTAETTLYLDGG